MLQRRRRNEDGKEEKKKLTKDRNVAPTKARLRVTLDAQTDPPLREKVPIVRSQRKLTSRPDWARPQAATPHQTPADSSTGQKLVSQPADWTDTDEKNLFRRVSVLSKDAMISAVRRSSTATCDVLVLRQEWSCWCGRCFGGKEDNVSSKCATFFTVWSCGGRPLQRYYPTARWRDVDTRDVGAESVFSASCHRQRQS